MRTEHKTEFDAFASNYDDALQKGISLSGESKEFFAHARVEWLRTCLESAHFEPARILDFGCGTGTSIAPLLELFSKATASGVDVSAESVAVARERNASNRADFSVWTRDLQAGEFDLAFCNGVFHHIAPEERGSCLQWIFDHLQPGGFFAFWENNPWNPGTHLVMRRIEFDKDAIMISPSAARRLLRRCGFRTLRCESLFYFPRFLGFLRPLEKGLHRLPLGAQYQLLCRKPVPG